MRKPVILITGAGGEIGHGLITRLAETGRPIVTLDLAPLDSTLAPLVQREFIGSIIDEGLLERILSEFEVDLVFHLAALLSTRSEFTPVRAHEVNVEGTLNLLEFAQHEGESHGRPVDLPLSLVDRRLRPARSRRPRRAPAAVREDEFNASDDDVRRQQAVLRAAGPLLRAALQAAVGRDASAKVDFRCVRFPGLISAMTVPSGGTSDYAPEMIHAAARGEPYECFVRPDTTIPFMAMPDGVEALLALAAAPRERLLANGLQRRGVQPVGRRDSRRRHARVSGRARSATRSTQAPGDRRLVARGRGRFRGPAGLGLRAGVRFRSRVQRVPHPDDSKAVSMMTDVLPQTMTAIEIRTPGRAGRADARVASDAAARP